MIDRTSVYGPVYLDYVLRVDGPLLPPELETTVDRSARVLSGQLDAPIAGGSLTIADETGRHLIFEGRPGVAIPSGFIEIEGSLSDRGSLDLRQHLTALSITEDLGGMGAGFAKALDGDLHAILGDQAERSTQKVQELIKQADLRATISYVHGKPSDSTLLISSGPHGDKLAIGFRGCLDKVDLGSSDAFWSGRERLRVVAGWPNDLTAIALKSAEQSLRLFAPNARNLRDGFIYQFAESDWINLLCLNRGEWELLNDHPRLKRAIPMISVTDGPQGASVFLRSLDDSVKTLRVDSFPRERPPRDTNRAGEAYAATLVATLIQEGWSGGVADSEVVEIAIRRASAAAALVLDLVAFGFPSDEQIDEAVERGFVP